jgi:hypothetical protein
MVVVRITRPTLAVEKDKAVKPAAYGYVAKPPIDPGYPVQVVYVTGKGKYRLIIAGDGSESAVFKVYVDGSDIPADVAESSTPAVVEGVFNQSVTIMIEGSGLHSSFVYEVWRESEYVTSVSVS